MVSVSLKPLLSTHFSDFVCVSVQIKALRLLSIYLENIQKKATYFIIFIQNSQFLVHANYRIELNLCTYFKNSLFHRMQARNVHNFSSYQFVMSIFDFVTTSNDE